MRFNLIKDITKLDKTKFEKLEILDIQNNQITYFDIFNNKENFPKLKELYLYGNKISDENVLEYFKNIQLYHSKDIWNNNPLMNYYLERLNWIYKTTKNNQLESLLKVIRENLSIF